MGESEVIAAGAVRSAFSGASQHNRLMRLDFPLKDGPPAILLPNRLVAHEEVSRGFYIKVEVLSDEARIPLKMLMSGWADMSIPSSCFSFVSRAMCAGLFLALTLSACKMKNDLPRNEKLPLFNPHRADFICQEEASKVPPIDAEADAWFLEARALETDHEITEDERDWKKIVQLTRQAAERRHWKAMFNLASLYLDGRDPKHGIEYAVLLVEQGMRLGIPAAYDRMGTYYMNGAVQGSVSQAYAFWQKAAEMGNPQAMTFLGKKLMATWDSPREGFWANIPIGTKMLECALGQGDGQAALALQYQYKDSGTPEGKTRAMRVLHEGVKLGCAKCAHYLQLEFIKPDPKDMIVPHMDKNRGERYEMLGDALDFNPSRRFPNIDKMIPLPPARLPSWDGKRETLLKAVMAVTLPKAKPKTSAASQRKGREALDAAYDFRPTDDKTSARNAPFAAYWQPTALHEALPVREHLSTIAPALYRPGEAFIEPRYPADANRGDSRCRLGTAADRASQPRCSRATWARRPDAHGVRAEATPLLQCGSSVPGHRHLAALAPAGAPDVACSQPTVATGLGHRRTGFPQPQNDWLLPLDARELTWHLLDSEKPDLEHDRELR